MDLEIVGFDALLASETAPFFPSSISTSDFDPKQRLHGSGTFLPKPPHSQPFSQRSAINGGNSISENGQQMLCFSHPNSQAAPTGYGYGGVFNRVRGPFTQSQWMELENQALIFKYINANAPVPSNLLIPILKASHYPHFPPFSACWAPFHLRFSNSADPEPGRCRRTDGKKWRCSKDAVPDQKYCERHMNRGRHRSRKPVENQPAHSVSLVASKLPAPAPAPAPPEDGLSLSQPGGPHPTPNNNGNSSQSILYPSSNSKMTQFSGGPSQATYGSSYHDTNEKDYLLKNNSWLERSDIEPDIQLERTQLSMSIPAASEPSTKMGLGFGIMKNEKNSQRQASNNNWTPISWGSASIGGPLGEALNKTNRNSSALDLRFGSVSNSSSGSTFS